MLILDGWGVSRNKRGNALFDAYTPSLDTIAAFHPSLALQASGFSVGMLWGEPGNSEAGHACIGTGRIIYNHLPIILHQIQNGSFFENPVLLGAVSHAVRNGSNLHLVGLVSGSTTHSYLDHLFALFELVKKNGAKAWLHAITDGRDTTPRQGLRVIENVMQRISGNRYPVSVVSAVGRYYAMDRGGAWDRVRRAYNLLTEGEGEPVNDIPAGIKINYDKGVTDEFMPPMHVESAPVIADNDAVIFFNFREDGMRELATAFAEARFEHFDRRPIPNLYIAAFTEYAKDISAGIAFPSAEIKNVLSEMLSKSGVKQLKITEARKSAHLTSFFSGGKEEPYPFENRAIIPPENGAGYSQNPGMCAEEIGREVVRAVDETAYELIVANFPNADAAAHEGNYESVIRAAEAIDAAVGRIYQSIVHRRGALIITSDHGAAEELFNTRTGEIKTGHSDNPVPFYFVTARNRFHAMRTEEELEKRYSQPLGMLADVAPTILELLGVKKPPEMTGSSLLGLL